MALVLDGDNGIVGVLATNADGDVIIDTNTFHVDAVTNRVGIGTTSPSQILHLSSSSSRVRIQSTAADEASINFDTPSGQTYMGGAGANGELIVNSSAGDFVLTHRSGGKIHLSADSTFTDSHLTISETGYVGIGNREPAYALDVRGGSSTANGARIKTGDNGYDGLIVSSSAQLKTYPSAGQTVKLTGYNSGGSTRDGITITTADTPYGEISTNIQSVTEFMGHYVNDSSNYGTANDKYVDLEDWSPTDFRILEIFGTANPNSGGSGAYADPVHMYVYNGTGWNGASVTYYVYGHSIAPAARTVYNSGSGSSANSDVEVFWKSTSAEQDAVTSSTAGDYHLRLYFPNVNTTYGTNINLRVIKRA